MYGEHLCFIFVVFIERTLLLMIMNCVNFVRKLRNWNKLDNFNTEETFVSCVNVWSYQKVNFLFMTGFM